MSFLQGFRDFMALTARAKAEDGIAQPFYDKSLIPAIPSREDYYYMTPRRALTIDTVYRAVSILQTAAVQLTLDQWRGTEKIIPSDIVEKPNPLAFQHDFIVDTVTSLALYGNAYWLRINNPETKRAVYLYVLDPREVTPHLDSKTGEPIYAYRNKTYKAGAGGGICHLRYFNFPGEIEGISPIQAWARGFTGAIKTEEAATTWLESSGVPTGILETDQEMDEDELDEAKKRWNQTASYSGGVAVLGTGLKYRPIMKPQDIEFLESRAYDARAICRIFGIPAHQMLLGIDGSSLTYQNVTAADAAFIRWTLMRYLTPIERTLSALLPVNNYVKFNIDGFLRATTKERYESYKLLLDSQLVTPQWVQETEGLPIQTTTRKDTE